MTTAGYCKMLARMGEGAAFPVMAPFNMSEQPAYSICAGYDADGLLIGL